MTATTTAKKIALNKLREILGDNERFYFGFSRIKGWVFLDRRHPEYNPWNRPFILLNDGSIEPLSKDEFIREPEGPWGLMHWKRLDRAVRKIAGPPSAQLPKILRYLETAGQVSLPSGIDASPPNETPCPAADFNFLKYPKTWQRRNRHYDTHLPRHIRKLNNLARRIQGGRLDCACSRGIEAKNHLHANGIHHLWHFTDKRNLGSIRERGGLFSWGGLLALGIHDVYPVANEHSRNRDIQLERENYVRLSFIPNSWFFQRVHKPGQLVWLRFSLSALLLGTTSYSPGNAASGFIALRNDLPRMNMDWEIVKQFSGPYTDDAGPTVYPNLYRDQVDDCGCFRKISNMWNSEILAEHFLPFEFCNGIFDCETGKIMS